MAPFDEDRLLTGRGRYLEDRTPEGCLHMAVLRSPLAHAGVAGLDVTAARAAPGVRLVLTAADLERLGIGPLACRASVTSRDGTAMIEPHRPVLAGAAVKHVGQPIAAVVAETLEAALDALEAIELSLDELPTVVEVEAAATAGAPAIWEEAPGNRAFDWEIGNRAETEAAFADAAHVVALTVRHPRIVIAPIETRGALAAYDAGSGRFTLWTASQGVVSLRTALANCLGIEGGRLRVVTEDVGGSFAVKIWPYPEQVLALAAARETGRPVKWTASRSEAMVADAMGRGRVDRAELALDGEGRFLAFRIDALADLGAFLNTVAPMTATKGAVRVFGHCYRIVGLHYRVQGIFTNAVPTDAYRGAGKPETVSTLERLIDVAAARLGLDRVELRRRNLVTPADLPYATAMGESYDGGDFPAVLERALEAADWAGFEERRAQSRGRGRLRGAGVGLHLHATGGSTAERSEVLTLPDGTVRVRSGSQDSGQGHRRALALVAGQALGIPASRVRVEQGDSDWLEIGGGTGGSNLLAVAGNTVHRASLQMLERMKASAGLLLEAAAGDIEYGEGRFRIVGTDRGLSLAEVAAGWAALEEAQRAADPEAGCLGRLDFEGIHTTFPNGAYVAEVEIDPETGEVRVVRFTGVDDLGRVIDPPAALGQLHGGIAQEIGEILSEAVRYDPESGQLLSGSLLDYALPRADEMPTLALAFAPTESPNSLIGAKGVGELPSIGAPGPILNAVLDALRESGVEHLDPPLTPEVVWRALHGRAQG